MEALSLQADVSQITQFRYRPTHRILANFFRRLTDFLQFGGVLVATFFSADFGGGPNSADPDVRQR